MKKLLVCVLLIMTVVPASAEQTDLYDGQLSLMVPDDFSPQSQEFVVRTFRGADHGWIQRTGDRTLDIRILREQSGGDEVLSVAGQRQAREMEEKEHRRIRRQGLVQINGREWYAVAFVDSSAWPVFVGEVRLARVEPHRIVMVTAMLLARDESDDHDEILRAIVGSLVLR